MSSLSSMILKLKPLNLYNLNEDSLVYAELAAFAVGLDMVETELGQMLRETFVMTAESYGIENLEREIGSVLSEFSIDKRREMLIERLSLGTGDFTPAGFEKMMRALGVEGSIEEYPTAERIVVNLSDSQISNAQRHWIVSQINMLVPAHLECDVVFSGIDWKYIDSLLNSFSQIDQMGYSWKEIDYEIQKG